MFTATGVVQGVGRPASAARRKLPRCVPFVGGTLIAMPVGEPVWKPLAGSISERVLAETLKMEKMMPALLKRIPGMWIVFRDSRVQSRHRSIEAAFNAAIKRYGLHGAFVISRVEPLTPKRLWGAHT